MTWISKALFHSAILLMMSPIPALAATPSTAPNQGDKAVSFNAGLVRPFDNHFENTNPVFTGTFEYYTSQRVSWRGMLGIMSFDADVPGNPSIDATFLTANILYNWEGGRIHPYVTGGVGLYQKDAPSTLPSKFDQTVFGLNGGGGIDWFLGTRWALEFEGTLHNLTGENPNTALLGTVGVKFWF